MAENTNPEEQRRSAALKGKQNQERRYASAGAMSGAVAGFVSKGAAGAAKHGTKRGLQGAKKGGELGSKLGSVVPVGGTVIGGGAGVVVGGLAGAGIGGIEGATREGTKGALRGYRTGKNRGRDLAAMRNSALPLQNKKRAVYKQITRKIKKRAFMWFLALLLPFIPYILIAFLVLFFVVTLGSFFSFF